MYEREKKDVFLSFCPTVCLCVYVRCARAGICMYVCLSVCVYACMYACVFVCVSNVRVFAYVTEEDRQINRQTNRTRETDRRREGEGETETEKQRETHTEKWRERKRQGNEPMVSSCWLSERRLWV